MRLGASCLFVDNHAVGKHVEIAHSFVDLHNRTPGVGHACTVDLWTQELRYHRLCADCCRYKPGTVRLVVLAL